MPARTPKPEPTPTGMPTPTPTGTPTHRPPHALPGWLRPVLDFVNTIDVEAGTDTLAAGPASLAAWLAENALVSGAVAPTKAQYELALQLRRGLRALVLLNNHGEPGQTELDDAMAAFGRLPLVAVPRTVEDGVALATATEDPVLAGLGRLAAAYATAVANGQWHRLRRCPAEDCAWVFWDSSAKGTRRWCTMRVCGNRAKVRALAERRRQGR